jgi:hypothetical protein
VKNFSDLCAREDCRRPRNSVVHAFIGSLPENYRHAFVEPAPAPQPPADAAPLRHATLCEYPQHCYKQDDGTCPAGCLTGCDPENGTHTASCLAAPPAGPPVTGEGDALCRECENRHETAQEIADHWIDRWNGGEGGGRGAVEGAVREAIARGRALGAREERADIIRDAHESHCYCCPGRPRCPICEFADEIARRAGRGQC